MLNQKLRQTIVLKDNFLRIMVHDLRHPLTAFQDLADLINHNIKQGCFDAVEEIACAIDTSSTNIRLLMDNLLLEQNQHRSISKYISLLSCLQNNVNLYQHIFDQKNIRFKLQCSEHCFVYVNPVELDVVLRNLLDNALKAVDKDHPEFSIDVFPSYQGNTTIINFNNNGVPMKEEQQLAINHLFVNAPKEWQPTEHIGFGMWLIAKYVKKNKGKISCISNEKTHETIFSLSLPNF